jgi:DNA-binding SARP family transcriptional activator
MEAAAHHLEAGLKLGEKHGYHFSFMLNKQDMLQVCLLALELRLEGTWGYVSRILSTRLADLAGPELEKLLYHHEKRVAERAWEIRRAIHRARRPRVRLQTLGGFLLRRGEIAMAEDDWEGRQPQLLLKALLAHGAHGVVKDVLLEDLWPEADPEGAEKNFKVNLHRLRKSLEPDLDKTFGSSYIHLKANLVSVDAELCDLDVEKFLAGVKEGEKKETQGQVKEAISLYKNAVASYGGDFLPEERYFPWVDAKREKLRQTYQGFLHRLARLYEKQGALTRAIDCYKRLLDSDPLDEPACQRLMLLYAQKGRRSAALKVYQDCCLALKKELNTEPDEVTSAIHRKILASP